MGEIDHLVNLTTGAMSFHRIGRFWNEPFGASIGLDHRPCAVIHAGMSQSIATAALVVADYDDAITFYCDVVGFDLVADVDMGGGKRWVLVAPPGRSGAQLLLARADGEAQRAAMGNQGGGRVMFFLNTTNFQKDHATMVARGVTFLEAPRHEPYGSVAVFEDLYGNKWDLIEPKN